MNAERLLEHYGRIADAPDAIARLRRFILDLAVRGKLVPQDPSDEPASGLVKRITAERDERAKEGNIRKGKALSPIEVRPFDVPQGWAWLA
jgi:type I restriction enzyme S subunit